MLRDSATRRRLVGAGGLAQAGDGLPYQPRDVHLGHPDAGADLRLREVLLEAQAQHLALPLGQDPHQALDGGRVLGDREAGVLDADRVRDPARFLVVLLARAVQGHGAVRRRRLARLEDLLRAGPDGLCDLRGRGRPAELAAHLLADAVDLDRELLEVARDAHRPALVAEVALELAEDGRHGEAGERGLAVGIEAVDRLEQTERSDLDEVVEGLAAALVAPRELAGERQEALDQRVARGRVAAVVVLDEQTPVLARTSRARLVGQRLRVTGRATGIC